MMPDETGARERCSQCGAIMKTPAEAWLHAYVHRQTWEGWGRADGEITQLPFALYPAVAKAMHAYAESTGGTRPPETAP